MRKRARGRGRRNAGEGAWRSPVGGRARFCYRQAARAILRQGSFTEWIASESSSTAAGRSKLVRQASATLREGTGAANGTTLSSLEAYRGVSAEAGSTEMPSPEATMLR